MTQREALGTRELRVEVAEPGEREALRALLDAYLLEHAAYLEPPAGATSAGRYPYLPLYWRGAGRYPFLVGAGDAIVGFALICHPSSTRDRRFRVAEFYIRPSHRRAGFGRAALRVIWARFPGRWTLQVLARNTGARAFWSHCIEEATGRPPTVTEIRGNDGPRIRYEFAIAKIDRERDAGFRGSEAPPGVPERRTAVALVAPG